jgi:hypothetical protein
MRNVLLILLALFALGAGTLAQEFPEREIITVLDMGTDVFEPDLWLASAAETRTNTTATWQSTFESGFSALSYISYLHFDEGYTLDGLDDFFGNDWFEQTFVSWEDLRQTDLCFDDDVTLYEFTLAFRDANDNVTRYTMRYWTDPLTETRVRTWYIAFATTYSDGTSIPDALEQLDDYSARIYPDLSTCP